MSNVKNLFLLTQIHEKQGIRLSLEEGAPVLEFADRAKDLLRKLAGKLPFDSEPAGYAEALQTLRK